MAASACGGSGLSKAQAQSLVALSLSGNTYLRIAAFTGTFCESDEGRRLRSHPAAGTAVPSNVYAFGRMAGNQVLQTLVADGYVAATEDTLPPEEAEARYPACGKRASCAGCPVISVYHVATYQLTPKGKALFLVSPATENEFTSLYGTGLNGGSFEDVQQALGDDMPSRISVAIATREFDVTGVTTDGSNKTGRVEYEWYWKPTARADVAPLQPLIPSGRTRAAVDVKRLDDGWHLARDAAPIE